MTLTELSNKILAVLPNALFDEDASGELIIATGFSVDKFANLIPLDPEG